jgi:hypothetical protein
VSAFTRDDFLEMTGGRTEPGCAPQGARPAGLPLPCRNRNNSISKVAKPYKFTPLANVKIRGEGVVINEHRDGSLWQSKDGVHAKIPGWDGDTLKGADAKRAFILRRHVEAFLAYWDRHHSLFFTTTDGQGLSAKEYARRWNSLLANEGDWIKAFVRVLEPQKNGRPHFHNLVAVEWDTKPDEFNWDAFNAAGEAYREKNWPEFRKQRAIYVASATPELRQLWQWGRRVMPAYGLGRCEILPVRKQGAIAEYIGKYLDKGLCYRVDRWKGVRRFETDRRTSQEWKRCGSKFSWYSPGSVIWRRRVGDIAFALGVYESGDLKAISRRLGAGWAYQMRGSIFTANPEEWRELMETLAQFFSVQNRDSSLDEKSAESLVNRKRFVPGSGAKGAPVSQDTEVPGEAIGGFLDQNLIQWDVLSERLRAGQITKLTPFLAIVPGGS